MSDYFIPKLAPSQVHTAGEYLVAHNQHISHANMESVKEADLLLEQGERVKFAFIASFVTEGKSYPGVVIVSSHNFYCCSSVLHNFVAVQMPYSACIGIGDIKGLLTKKLPIHCEDVAVEISGTSAELAQLTQALLDAISSAPQQNAATTPDHARIIHRSSQQYAKTESIKQAHRGERRLSKAEQAAYGKCPSCGGTMLCAKKNPGGELVFCPKCGMNLGKLKK